MKVWALRQVRAPGKLRFGLKPEKIRISSEKRKSKSLMVRTGMVVINEVVLEVRRGRAKLVGHSEPKNLDFCEMKKTGRERNSLTLMRNSNRARGKAGTLRSHSI